MTDRPRRRRLASEHPESVEPGIPDTAAAGQRFGFGQNWRRFLRVVNNARIQEAQNSLTAMLGPGSLLGRTFLDIGSGSGLFSLAAVRLGAARVHSFDFDLESVACTKEVRRRFGASADSWTVERGDILDAAYMDALGTWDVVYAWGVLHHTGSLWRALKQASERVAPGGLLYVAIYNDQGALSRGWHAIKRRYQQGPFSRVLILAIFIPYFVVRGVVSDLFRREPIRQRYRAGLRGMSARHDWIDWLGGYPFEVAKPEQVVEACNAVGFRLIRLGTVGGRLGNNEYVFERGAHAGSYTSR